SFRTVDFATLVDSPIFAGRHFRQIGLDPGAKIPVRLNIVADEDRFLDIKPEQVKAHRELVRQAYKLYRSQHYDHYDFLLALSGQLGEIGLEHHRSSENGVPAAYFTEWTRLAGGRDLLPHEYTHSWNGKFRRPAGLATPNFNVPVDAALIWVYEGLTQYWGDVLAARSGLRTQEQARDEIARVAAMYADARPGFAWRDLQDTTTDPVLAQRRPLPYANYQLSEEYYSAGALVWLAVDAKLRELSHERKSLDDFARAFFGIDDGALKVKTYTFDDVVAALNAVAPHDWAAFLRARLDAHVSPLDGIAAAGWRLAYTDTASEYQKNGESVAKVADFAVSIGLTLDADSARITEVIWNSPAFKAGIGPGGTLVAVDGTEYKAEEFTRALQAARTHGQPIELLVKNANRFRTYRVDYHGGPRYPHLERIPGSVDRLGAIYAPR
ncbi:MAG: M61 family metallopeptidase, partial [Proteobacteria bacterium]|nr:M61 family metallopeptidase [Pseudomonadota bacterium]